MMEKPKILVVDDESIVTLDLRQRLEHLDYAFAGVAGSGEEAVTQAEENRPDLVLMDIRMPGNIDGIEAANRIREKYDIPVIYVTAYGDEATLARAKVTEPLGYILKPFTDRDLRTAIEVGLCRNRIEQQLKQKIREVTGLNNLCISYLQERDKTETAFNQLVERLMRLAEEMQTLSAEARLQKERLQLAPIDKS